MPTEHSSLRWVKEDPHLSSRPSLNRSSKAGRKFFFIFFPIVAGRLLPLQRLPPDSNIPLLDILSFLIGNLRSTVHVSLLTSCPRRVSFFSFLFFFLSFASIQQFANTASASLFYAGTANLDTPLALPNTSYTANSTLSNVHQLSQGSISYRRVVTESDSLDVGGDATQGWFNGNPVYFFDFGNDGNIAAPAIFIIGNSTKNVTIFSSQSTHFVTKTIVTPPADSKVNLDDIDRVSDIPAAWLSNSTLTTVGTTVYELGFIRVAGTPPPQAAASIAMPSIAALLFAALLAILL